MSIDQYNDTIDKSQVDERVTELEDERGYDVVRVRNDEVIETFTLEEDATDFINTEDYDPARVVVRQGQLDEADTDELARLRELDSEMDRAYGSGWLAGDTTLYSSGYFDAAWAQEQARDSLNLTRYVDLDNDFPFDYIDWDSVASSKRDNEYSYVRFDGVNFYAEDR
jgi:hypothetical protein